MTTDWDKKRKGLISRLRRVEGQLRGIQKMMEEEQDCERVAQQLSAARKALDKTFFETMACAMQQELAKADGEDPAMQSSAKRDEQIQHITALLTKYG
ncbi:hypothetical protein IMCC21906_00354 [Spongiibacter sp. IMCC21906]|jgi:DNA-binding FrmR family transcriptional regulator|uniref:metal-sensitive transcriptional regulator n=1 Tax=Spongiibacter sp. IMCC21906 TaxID=1620392 RepID=UPI00062E0932|nr:metal-sensing transcriptional repressor [Spongiibacter sp. IMCC21906]AKH68047.1 hypothetical protein IMCC21906_00354 [Spongiibacter sp. IMCC21906]